MKPRFRPTASTIRSRSLRSLQPRNSAIAIEIGRERFAHVAIKPSKLNLNITPCIEDDLIEVAYRVCPIAKACLRERDLLPRSPHLPERKRKHERMERTPSIDIIVIDVVATIAEGNFYPTSGRHIEMSLSSTCLRLLVRLYRECIGLAR